MAVDQDGDVSTRIQLCEVLFKVLALQDVDLLEVDVYLADIQDRHDCPGLRLEDVTNQRKGCTTLGKAACSYAGFWS